MKKRFNNWLKENKLNITKPERYSRTITTISNDFKKKLNKNIDLYEVRYSDELEKLKVEYFNHKEFYEKNKTGNNMYSRSLELYIEFLKTNFKQMDYIDDNDNILNEIEKIKNDIKLTNTEKETIILSRIGQGKYCH